MPNKKETAAFLRLSAKRQRSKGLGFDRVIIYPTKEMMDWLKGAQSALKAETRAKLYVALTRVRHTVAVVHDLSDGEVVPGFTLFQ